MTNVLKAMIVAVMMLGFTGCVSTSDIEVEALKSDKVNLDGYTTYEIIEDSGVVTETKIQANADVDAELQTIIHSELAKKGKNQVTKNPDFYVAYLAGTDLEAIKMKVDAAGQETIKEVSAAAMILILVDAHTGMIIGISTAVGEMKNLSLEDRRTRLTFTIKKMFSEL